MNNHSDQSVTPEPSAEREDKRNTVLGASNTPQLVHVSTDNSIGLYSY